MTAAPVVPTLRHHAPENRPFEGFLAASCESRVRLGFGRSWPDERGPELRHGSTNAARLGDPLQ
jgi:hypothetical protein